MYLLMNEFSGIIQPSHLIDKETERQPNLAKIMALDCDEFLPRPRKQGPGAKHWGWGGHLTMWSGHSLPEAGDLLYHQAKDGWKCHIQPNLGKLKS